MPVHDRVKGFIRQQVHDGVTNVAEVTPAVSGSAVTVTTQPPLLPNPA